MSRKFLFVTGAALLAVLLFALGDTIGHTPKASAEPYSVDFDITLNPADPADGETVDVVTVVDRDTVGSAAPGESFFSEANSVWTGLTPGSAPPANIGDEAGSISFYMKSNLSAAVTSNVLLSTGQPPRCGTADLGTEEDPVVFPFYASTLDDTTTVSHLDTDDPADGFRETEEDEDDDGIYDGVTAMPEALADTVIPALGLGDPVSRGFGVALVNATLSVTTDVHFIVWDLTANPDVQGYISLSIIGYPGLAAAAPSAGTLTETTVITCTPFSVEVTVFGQSQSNTTICGANGPGSLGCEEGSPSTPSTPGGADQRTAVGGSHTYRLDTTGSDNYDGDLAPNAHDTCREITSTNTDVAGADPDSDNWDSACDPDPASADNDGDTDVDDYNTPGIGLWGMDDDNCNHAYTPALTGGWACDQDIDGDGTLNTVDNCPFDADEDIDNADGDSNVNTGVDWQLDTDEDGVGDVCDPEPTIKGDGSGYDIDAHPHGFNGSPGGYTDHDDRCTDDFTVDGSTSEPADDGGCLGAGADEEHGTGDSEIPWVDSDDDVFDPDWADMDGSTTYDIGEPIDTDGDADGDLYSDACEAVSGTDPLEPASTPSSPATTVDTDGDTVPDTSDCDGGGGADSWEEAALNLGVGTYDFTSGADDTPDTDSDGCTDLEEVQPVTALGGGRDHTNYYDFYDITNISFVIGAKDKAVTVFDLQTLLTWGGASDGGGPNPNGKDYNDDGNSNTIDDGEEMDYAGLVGFATGPDGAITVFDLQQLLNEGGDNCQGPPN